MMGDKIINMDFTMKSSEMRETCTRMANDMATGKAHAKVQPTGENSNDGGGYQF